jgi:hypothetical protein
MTTINQIETAARAGWNLVAECHLQHETEAAAASGVDIANCMDPGSDFLTALSAYENQRFSLFFSGGIPVESLTLLSAETVTPESGAELPPAWIAPVAAFWESLLTRLADPQISDEVAIRTVESAARRLPELADAMDVEALADLFESAMGQAVAVTAQERHRKHSRLLRTLSAPTVKGVAFAPLADAVARMDRKTPVASRLSSAQWAEVPLALRERAFFSAKVESVRFLANAQDKIKTRLSLEREKLPNGKEAFVNRDSFIRDMRRIAQEEGIQTTGADGRGTIRDIRSVPRLGLIYDMQVDSATGYARWKIDHDPDVLDEFPAYRLGPSSATQPRPESYWRGRWMEAGGSAGWQGASRIEMTALKTSPIWTALSVFGTPWPPFDYGSSRMLEDVDRDEATALGLVKETGPVPDFGAKGSTPPAFNDSLEASVSDWSADQVSTLKLAFGDQVQEKAGKLAWQGNIIGDLYTKATTDPQYKASLDLGIAMPRAINMAAAQGTDLSGYTLQIKADDIRHANKRHGGSSGDRDPISKLDIEVIPHVWRDPDQITKGANGVLRFKKNVAGRLVMAEFQRSEKNKLAGIKTIMREGV